MGRYKRLQQKFLAFSNLLNWVVLRIAMYIMASIFIVAIIEIFFRYVLGRPIVWSFTLLKVLTVWGVILSISVAFKSGEHVAVEGVVRLLPRKYQRIVLLIGYLFIALYMIVLVWQGLLLLMKPQGTILVLNISYRWILASVPVTAAIHLVHLLVSPLIIQEVIERGEKIT